MTPASVTTEAVDTDSIQVAVTQLTSQAGHVEYHYTVRNRSAQTIYMLNIGTDEVYGGPKLAREPLGWDGDTIPSTSYQSPPGWNFVVQPTEEESLIAIRWEKTAQGRAIGPGESLQGFVVVVAQADPEYGKGGFWSAYVFGNAPVWGGIKSGESPTPSR